MGKGGLQDSDVVYHLFSPKFLRAEGQVQRIDRCKIFRLYTKKELVAQIV